MSTKEKTEKLSAGYTVKIIACDTTPNLIGTTAVVCGIQDCPGKIRVSFGPQWQGYFKPEQLEHLYDPIGSTPGPWHVHVRGDYPLTIRDSDRNCICELSMSLANFRDAEAKNAQLIAAAPRMAKEISNALWHMKSLLQNPVLQSFGIGNMLEGTEKALKKVLEEAGVE